MVVTPIVSIAAIAVLGTAAQWLAWRIRLPSILLLLLFGFAAGPLTGFLKPEVLLGDLFMPLISISVALILYEGGLTLRFAELRRFGGVVPRLVTIGAAITWLVSAIAAHFLFGFGLGISALLGAILVVTGPTVIGPMLKHIRPSGAVGPVLKWEGIVIDPIGATLAVLVFEALSIQSVGEATAQILFAVIKTALFGGGIGLLAAGVLTLLLYRFWIPDSLQNAVSLAFVVAAFAASNALQHESGLLATTVMGMALANQRFADVKHIVEFKENLRVLLISALFILLAAQIHPAELASVAVAGGVLVLVLVLVARPLSVLAATAGSKLKQTERLFIAGVAPRGIVAAAVASVFAYRLEVLGYADARQLVPVTFMVIIGTVTFYGLGSPVLARRLGVAALNPQGVLFVGAQAWVRSVAKILSDKGIRVLLIDANWENSAASRMAGLPTFSGSALGEDTLDEIDLGGIGRLFAVTPNDYVNMLAVERFRSILGRSQSYQLAPREKAQKHQPKHRHMHGRMLFGSEVTADKLSSMVAAGAVVKATKLSESFDYEAFKKAHGNSAIVMFTLTETGSLRVVTAGEEVKPAAGQTVIALVPEKKEPSSTSYSEEPRPIPSHVP